MQNSKSNGNGTGGIGFCGLLTLVFIVLKFIHVIDWSWIWVLSPTWIPMVLIIALAIWLSN